MLIPDCLLTIKVQNGMHVSIVHYARFEKVARLPTEISMTYVYSHVFPRMQQDAMRQLDAALIKQERHEKEAE